MFLALGVVVVGLGMGLLGHHAQPGGRRAGLVPTMGTGLFGSALGAVVAVETIGVRHGLAAAELAVLLSAVAVFGLQRYAPGRR